MYITHACTHVPKPKEGVFGSKLNRWIIQNVESDSGFVAVTLLMSG